MILLVMIHILTSPQGYLQNNNLQDKPIHVEQNMRTYDTLHRSETCSFWYKQCSWWKKNEKSWYIKEVQVCVYMLSEKKPHVMWLCNICKKNYNIDNINIANALSNRYREVGNKEFICKPCHTRLQNKHDNTQNSNSVDNSKNIDVMNSNDTTPSMEFNMTSLDFTQNPTYTNHCICTCCHKPDFPRSQCIIFKVQRYNSDNSVISQALSNHFIISTGKEFICKSVTNHCWLKKFLLMLLMPDVD